MKSFSYCFLIIISILLFSCNDDISNFQDNQSAENGGVISIGAAISIDKSTKSDNIYIEYGPVTQGTFIITYPFHLHEFNAALDTWEHKYTFSEVKFGFSGQEEIGFANMGTAQEPQELVWAPKDYDGKSDVNNGVWVRDKYDKGADLFLDNVIPPLASTPTNSIDTARVITFSDSWNPYVAGKFDNINGANDLLWGTTFAALGTPKVNFELHHNMCRIRVNITVDQSNDYTLGLSLKNAKVYITNIITTPEKYDRTSGNLIFSENPQREDLILVEPENWPGGSNPQGWISDFTDEKNVTLYQTADFVLPEQYVFNIQDVNDKPQLVILVPKMDYNNGTGVPPSVEYVQFSNYFPGVMYVEGEGGQSKRPVNFNFLKEHVITINTSMVPGSPELEFMPVTVERWVNKGSFNPSGEQAGIGPLASDFYQMIEYYNQNNTFQLGRYGFQNANGVWTFQFRPTKLTLELSEIQGMMIPGSPVEGQDGVVTPPYTIDTRNRFEALQMPDGTVYEFPQATASQNITSILQTPANTGVTSSEEFQNLIQAYNTKNWQAWQQGIYGEYDSTEKKWIFKIAESITLDYRAIVTQMISGDKFGFGDFSFVYDDGVTVTLTNYPDNVSQNPDPQELYDIVNTDLPGIYTTLDLSNLIQAYPSSSTLSEYGQQTANQWTFFLRRNLTVAESQLQGRMKGENYKFDMSIFSLTLSQSNGTTYAINETNEENLNFILNLNPVSGISDATGFDPLISLYNADNTDETTYIQNLSKYGYYCFGSGTASDSWVFVVNSNISLNYTDIAGKMIPSIENGQVPFSLNLGTNVVNIIYPDGSSQEFYGATGQTQLLDILSTPVEIEP